RDRSQRRMDGAGGGQGPDQRRVHRAVRGQPGGVGADAGSRVRGRVELRGQPARAHRRPPGRRRSGEAGVVTQFHAPDFGAPDDPNWSTNHSAEWPVTEGTTPPHHVIRLDNGDAERLPRLAALVARYEAVKRNADAAAESLKM